MPAPQLATQCRVQRHTPPVLASSPQIRARRGPLDADGAPGSPPLPASLPRLPAASRARSLLQTSTLGSPAWDPPPTPSSPRGPLLVSEAQCGQGRKASQDPGARQRWLPWAPALRRCPQGGESGCGNGVALARSSSSTMSRAGEGGRDTTRSIEHRASVGPSLSPLGGL